MLRVYACAFSSISMLFVYIGLRMPLSSRSIAGPSALGPGASGLPYYCTSPVTVPDVIGGLAVWRHINQKIRHINQKIRHISACRLHAHTTISTQIIGSESKVHSGSSIRIGQAFLGFLITAHHLCTFLMKSVL